MVANNHGRRVSPQSTNCDSRYRTFSHTTDNQVHYGLNIIKDFASCRSFVIGVFLGHILAVLLGILLWLMEFLCFLLSNLGVGDLGLDICIPGVGQ